MGSQYRVGVIYHRGCDTWWVVSHSNGKWRTSVHRLSSFPFSYQSAKAMADSINSQFNRDDFGYAYLEEVPE